MASVTPHAGRVSAPRTQPSEAVSQPSVAFRLPPRFDLAEQVSVFQDSMRTTRYTLLDLEGRKVGIITHNPWVGTKLEDARGLTIAIIGKPENPREQRLPVHDGRGKKLGTVVRRGLTGEYQILDAEDRQIARVQEHDGSGSLRKQLVLTDGAGRTVELTRYPFRGMLWDRWQIAQGSPNELDPRLWIWVPVLEQARKALDPTHFRSDFR
jgi:hypothetical protein